MFEMSQMMRSVCILSHREGVVMLSARQGILCVLGNYNGNTGTGKNGNWMRIGVEAPGGTNSRKCKNGRCRWPLDEQISKISATCNVSGHLHWERKAT